MIRRTTLILAVCTLLLGFGAASAGSDSSDGVPPFGHVFLIIGENTDYAHVNSTNMPFLMSSVRPDSAWLTNYYSATHWSQANYVALATGQFNSCEQHDGGAACHQNVDNLYHRLDGAGLTWTVWLEAGTSKCDTGSGGSCTSNTACPLTGFYASGNPPILFDDIEGTNGVWSPTPSSECLQNDVPAGTATSGMATFNAALASGNVPTFNTVIPNGCDDGESDCAPVHNRFTQFDDFLATEVPLIEASPAFGPSSVIIITYDEAQQQDGANPSNGLGDGGHTLCVVISPMVVPGNYSTQTYAYSVLRTLEDGFGISDHLGAANEVGALPVSWR